uniref:Uncharacterized protein n=2 Tax=Hyaloperonospora arabidopsidis (strain Emoy2) TaxID=559515 RepID=M4BAD3_HYAAE
MSSLGLSSLFNVKDKVLIITGGGRGIGKMMADGFVQNGARVYIVSRDLKACNITAQELTARGSGQCFAVGNIEFPLVLNHIVPFLDKLDKFYDFSNAFGPSSKLICRAKLVASSWQQLLPNRRQKLMSLSITRASHGEATLTITPSLVLMVNVTAPFHMIKFLLPLLDAAAVTSDAARIINVGSVAGLVPQPIDTIAYDTSKAAVHHMTRVLAVKLARRPNGGHILVNAIAPGLLPSKMSKGISMVTGQTMDDLAARIPIGRLGQDVDMAGLAIFLSSKASGWISGMVIASDGGQVYAAETGVGSAKL